MKKVYAWVSLLILIPLAAYSFSAGGTLPTAFASTATLSPEQVQTQINQLLTTLPTTTAEPLPLATETPALPTVAVVTATPETGAVAEATATHLPEASSTPQPEATTAVPTATTAAATAAATASPTAAPTQASGPTATLVPGDPRARLGSPSASDPMDNDTAWIWPTGVDQYSKTSFGGGAQTITALTTTDGWRLANPTGSEFGNVYLEATFRTTTCTGSDHYGLITRVPVLSQPTQGYLFTFTCDGKYSIRRWDAEVGPKGEMKRLVDWTASPAILTGSNQVNRMGVMLVGSRLVLYANGQRLAEAQDSVFPKGYFGVMLGSQNAKGFQVILDNMAYWLNPAP